ncbi:DUF4194 domain-containing protein [Tardiphaga sp. OK245]|uniref:DUF4194 domain-containing protein n=1 Tax=Tardiphaga sp. OK245 TaxID=1855306 RepID=UPI0008A724EA|nr:DUF4194 domain-containing protein [Tardiphaga sp. OK245]SEH43218.1 protein of unknown function [Tardiphaga sp. OK245]
MLLEFTTLESTNPRGFLRVTQLIAHLMRNQFVHAEDRGAAPLLETLHRPELNKLVEAYFDIAGYRLVHRQTEGWAGILPDLERALLPRMRIDETVVLLVMRRLWEEALRNDEIYDNGTVRTTLNEAYDAYQNIVAGTRRAGLTANDFRDVLQTLERRSIVRLGDLDADEQNMELDIRALVTSVAGDDFLASLEQLLSRPVSATADADDRTGAGGDA